MAHKDQAGPVQNTNDSIEPQKNTKNHPYPCTNTD